MSRGVAGPTRRGLAAVFANFESARKMNTDAIADMAIENFVEMRDRVADPRFLLKKKVELALEAKFPQLFVPKYAMVTFHRVPYSVALARGRCRTAYWRSCVIVDRLEDLDWGVAERIDPQRTHAAGAVQ